MSTRITLGKIVGLFGLRGWVKVFSYTNPVTNIFNYSPWQLGQRGQWQPVKVSEGQAHGKGLIARFETCQDRALATSFLGAEIAINREQLPPPRENEYYWADLIGLTVINQDQICLGEVDHLLATGANDVLVLKGDRERLIPFLLDQVILKIDLTQRLLQVDWDADF